MKARLEYQGKQWVVEVTPSTRYMWESGDYECDCNRSLFISRIDPTFPEMDCNPPGTEPKIRLVELIGEDDE